MNASEWAITYTMTYGARNFVTNEFLPGELEMLQAMRADLGPDYTDQLLLVFAKEDEFFKRFYIEGGPR